MASQFTRARTGENKLLAGFSFDQQMYDLKNLRQLLDFVNDDLPLLSGRNEFREALGSRGELSQRCRVQ